MTSGERVKTIRKTLGLTLVEFGDKIGLKNNSVSQIENGKNSLTEQTIKLICNEFNVSIAWLKDGKGDMFTNLPETLFDELANEYHLNDSMKKLIKSLLELDDESQTLLIKILENTFL